MAAEPLPRPLVQPRDLRWKWLLLTLCALASIVVFALAADDFGLGGRAWFGFWDCNGAMTGRPYVISVVQPVVGGAAAQAGLHDGDGIDLRDQSLDGRVGMMFQFMATRPTTLVVRRGARTFSTRLVGSTVWEGASSSKLPDLVIPQIVNIFFLGCALLISLKRWWVRDGRILALAMLCVIFSAVSPSYLVIPNPTISLLLSGIASVCLLATPLLLVNLSSRFGVRYAWRRRLEWFAYASNVLIFLSSIVANVGTFTLWVDPLPFGFSNEFNSYSLWGSILGALASISVAFVAAAAVGSTPVSQRPRVAWLLLPLSIGFAVSGIAFAASGFASSWFVLETLLILGSLFWLTGAFAVTYALLKRRVLDFEFVLSRTLVVGIISLIVVSAFVLLEWLLGSVLTGVSHATSLIANAGLALVIGLSMHFIHQRVDQFVDTVMFYKRRNDERALREFSNEAAFVTEPAALLDQAVANLQNHTDARAAALFMADNGAYKAVRRFGGAPPEVSENDPAILALKTWHKPVDPHHYATKLHGALAFPMVSRAHLLGVLLLGERAGGEAYAPDQVDAISEFAHGIGSAYDGLRDGAMHAKDDQLLGAIQKLGDAVVAEIRERNAALHASIERHFSR